MLKNKALMALIVAAGCVAVGGLAFESKKANDNTEPQTLAVPIPVMQAVLTAPAPQESEVELQEASENQYAGWQNWCEDLVKPECINDDDCKLDRTGRVTYCAKSPSAGEGDVGDCKPQWLNRTRQAAQRRNQRIIIDSICSSPSWWDDAELTGDPGRQCWKFKWRTAKACNSRRWCDPERLHRFLRIPAKREATWDHETDHHLNPDLLANIGAYKRQYRRETYANNPHFYEGLTIGKKGRAIFGEKNFRYGKNRCVKMRNNDLEPRSNQNIHDRNCNGVPDRWERGYGWYGTNAANFVFEVDPLAPPEVLCRRVPATLAVLRKARYAWKKLSNGLDCLDALERPYTAKLMRSGEQERDYKKDTHPEPTWWLLHRAVWGGDICPPNGEAIGMNEWYQKRFSARAKVVELDPNERVTLQMLGKPVDPQNQWTLEAELESQFEEVFPP